MPDESASDLIGKKALADLERLVVERWGRLSAAEKQRIGTLSPERFMLRVRSDLRRISQQPPLIRVPRRTVAERYKNDPRLLHLRPGGPAAQRERRGLSSKELFLGRPFDDRASALSYGRYSYSIKQLRAQQRTAIKLRDELRQLQRTPLGEIQIKHSPKWKALAQEVARGLTWYSRRFLAKVIREADQITTRKRLDTRRLVVKLLSDVEVITGDAQRCLMSDILNWRTPDELSEAGEAWTPRRLARWINEARQSG